MDYIEYSATEIHGVVSDEIGATETPVRVMSDDYEFPFEATFADKVSLLTRFDPASIIAILQKYSFSKRNEDGELCDYAIIRRVACSLSIALNLQGVVAPAFRPMRRPPRKVGAYFESAGLLSNDRQVIDMHWMYTKQLICGTPIGYGHLLDSDKPFDWKAASKYANLGGKKSRKAEAFSLSEYDELQLCSIQSKSTISRSETIHANSVRNIPIIRRHTSAPSSKLSSDIAKAMPDIHKAILIARGSPTLATKAYRFMTGKEIGLKSMQRYTKLMERLGILG